MTRAHAPEPPGKAGRSSPSHLARSRRRPARSAPPLPLTRLITPLSDFIGALKDKSAKPLFDLYRNRHGGRIAKRHLPGPSQPTQIEINLMQIHVLAGPLHSASALTTGTFLKATAPTAFAFQPHGLDAADVGAAPTAQGVTNGNAHDHTAGAGGTIAHGSLGSISANQHHGQAHALSGADHSGAAAISQIPTAAPSAGDSTHVPTSDQVNTFCETTKDYTQRDEALTSQDHYRDLFTAQISGATGALVLVFPKTYSHTEISGTLRAITNSPTYPAWELTFNGFCKSTVPAGWNTTQANLQGIAPFSRVRLGDNGTKLVLVLGETTTVWATMWLNLIDLIAAYANYTGYSTPWSASITNSLAGFTMVDVATIITNNIDHTTLASKGTNTHAQIDSFITSKAAASGLASLSAASLVVQDPASATATPTVNKIPIADGAGGKLATGWLPTEVGNITESAFNACRFRGAGGTLPNTDLRNGDIFIYLSGPVIKLAIYDTISWWETNTI